MAVERYFSEEWEWACCGGPVGLGQEVTLSVQTDSAGVQAMREELNGIIGAHLTGVEAHHDDDSRQIRGRVTALHAVIADMEWIVRAVDRDDERLPERLDLGEGFFAEAPEPETTVTGSAIAGTCRLVPITTVTSSPPVESDGIGRGRDIDVSVPGRQVLPALHGYLFTVEREVGDSAASTPSGPAN